MAADALTAAGKKAGIDLVVEPQGSSGYQALPRDVIDGADAVIFATDVDVREPGRFAGKPVVRSGVKRGIEQPDALIAEAIAAAKNPNGARVSGTADERARARLLRALLRSADPANPAHRRQLHDPVRGRWRPADRPRLRAGRLRDHNEASTVITENALWDLPTAGRALGSTSASVVFMIGVTSMGFLVSALAGYIAFAIADRPGIAPGFVAGAVAVLMNAGFIGGIVGGLLAGLVASGSGACPHRDGCAASCRS